MGDQVVIDKAGELVDCLIAAVQQSGAEKHSEIRVRIGTLGPIYQINHLKGVREGGVTSLLLELCVVPESGG
jgi:hypothetical protein